MVTFKLINNHVKDVNKFFKKNATLNYKNATKSKTTKENGKGFNFAHALSIIITCVERMEECTPEARVNVALPCTKIYLSNQTACNGKTLHIFIYFFSFSYIILYISFGNF